MTVDELSQLYWLGREIKADERRLKELERRARAPSIAHLTGMPHAPSNEENARKIERAAAEIVDLQAIIAAKQIQCIHEQARLERWIAAIPDSLTRQIFKARYVDGKTWMQVATSVGGHNLTESGVKMICHRYLKQTRKEEAEARNNG